MPITVGSEDIGFTSIALPGPQSEKGSPCRERTETLRERKAWLYERQPKTSFQSASPELGTVFGI